MSKPTPPRKLQLHRRTLRRLAGDDLARIAGANNRDSLLSANCSVDDLTEPLTRSRTTG